MKTFVKLMNIWHSYGKKVDCVVHFLRVVARRTILLVTFSNIHRF